MIEGKKYIKIFDRYRNELIQCYLRIGMIIIAFLLFFVLEILDRPIENRQTYTFLAGYLAWSLIYYALIRSRPELFPKFRTYATMLADIIATAYAMYLAGSLSAIFVPVFLWYMIGYGMRFGLSFTIIACLTTVMSWLALFVCSPYWSAHPYHFTGWLAAFLLIPSYYTILLKRLHVSLRELNIALLETEQLASLDPLTNIANRRHFNALAENLFEVNPEVAIF